MYYRCRPKRVQVGFSGSRRICEQGVSGSGIPDHNSSCAASTEENSPGSDAVEPDVAEPITEDEETVVVIVVAVNDHDAGSVCEVNPQHALENEDVLSSGEAVLE